MQQTFENMSSYWQKRYKELLENPPPMVSCCHCGSSRAEREIKTFKGICYDCNQKQEARQEKLDWLYAYERSGLVPEDKRFEFSKITPGLQHDSIINYLSRWSAAMSKGRGFYLAGNLGTGKTTLVKCIINQHLKQTLTGAMFLKYPDVFAGLKQGGFKDNPTRGLLNRAYKVALLVIDDLGVGAKARWAEDEIMPIIDSRWASRLPTIFNSNGLMAMEGSGHGLRMLSEDRITSRVLDRIREATSNHQIVLAGSSLRGRADVG